MNTTFESIIWKEGEFYVAQCLNVEVSSFGNTKEEAFINLQEAIELYFEDTPITEATQVENPEIFSIHLKHA